MWRYTSIQTSRMNRIQLFQLNLINEWPLADSFRYLVLSLAIMYSSPMHPGDQGLTLHHCLPPMSWDTSLTLHAHRLSAPLPRLFIGLPVDQRRGLHLLHFSHQIVYVKENQEGGLEVSREEYCHGLFKFIKYSEKKVTNSNIYIHILILPMLMDWINSCSCMDDIACGMHQLAVARQS